MRRSAAIGLISMLIVMLPGVLALAQPPAPVSAIEPGGASPHLPLKLLLRDAETGEPIREAEFAVTTTFTLSGSACDSYPWDSYRGGWPGQLVKGSQTRTVWIVSTPPLTAADGRYELTNIEWKKEDLISGAEGKERLERACDQFNQGLISRHPAAFRVAVAAPGYVRREYCIAASKLIAGEEFEFSFEPCAEARGRVLLFSESGPPLTLDAVGEWIRSQSIPRRRKSDTTLRTGSPEFRFQIVNYFLDRPGHIGKSSFCTSCNISIDSDGSFATGQLKPDDRWALILDVEGFPPLFVPTVALARGANDLGTFVLKAPGSIHIKAESQTGAVLPGSWVDFPVEPEHRQPGGMTDAAGEYRPDVNFLAQDAQVIRISPPWGHVVDEWKRRLKSIFWTSLVHLDRSAESRIEATLPEGHTLTLDVELPDEFDRMSAHYLNEVALQVVETYTSYLPARKFALSQVAITAAAPGDDGFTYNQLHELTTGVDLKPGGVRLQIPHVPPGRMLLRLDAGVFRVADPVYDKDMRALIKSMENTGIPDGLYPDRYFHDNEEEPEEFNALCSYPVGYIEFEMPDSDHERKIKISSSVVHIQPVGDLERMRQGDLDTLLIEREGALSFLGLEKSSIFFFGNEMISYANPERFFNPMVGVAPRFMRRTKLDEPWSVQPINLHGLPPGRYRVRFPRFFEDTSPSFETTFDIPDSPGAIINLSVPVP